MMGTSISADSVNDRSSIYVEPGLGGGRLLGRPVHLVHRHGRVVAGPPAEAGRGEDRPRNASRDEDTDLRRSGARHRDGPAALEGGIHGDRDGMGVDRDDSAGSPPPVRTRQGVLRPSRHSIKVE